MLKQHLFRENIAKNQQDECQIALKKKYFLRQNLHLLKQNGNENRENNSNVLSSTQSKPFQNSVKQIRKKRSQQSSYQEASSFDSQFSNIQPLTSFNINCLKNQLPILDSNLQSPQQTPKYDKQKLKHQSLKRKQYILKDIDCNKIQIQNIENRYIAKDHSHLQQTTKSKSKSFIHLAKRDNSSSKADKSSNYQSHQNSQDDLFKGLANIRQTYKKTVLSKDPVSLANISSFNNLQCKTPASPSNDQTYFKFPNQNLPTTQTSGRFVDSQEKFEEWNTVNDLQDMRRRQSLNLPQTEEFVEVNVNLNKCSDKKDSRVASLTRISEIEKQKFKQIASKMYIEKIKIADEEDIQFALQMQQEDEDEQHFVDDDKQQFGKNLLKTQLQSKENNNTSKNNIQQSSNSVLYDKICERPSTVIGENALEIFYNHYKNINKIIQQNEHYSKEHDIKESLQTKLIKTILDKNVLPKKLNLIKKNGNPTSLSFQNFNCDNKSAQIIAEGMKSHPLKNSIQQFSIKNSYLNSSICSTLLKSVPSAIIDLNLSKNNLDFQNINYLNQNFLGYHGKLQVLNLEKCKLNDENIISLLESLENNSSLRKLNLSQNQITSKSCIQIKKILLENYYIEELYLHWNQIKNDGGVLIAQSLQLNTTLAILDLSKNPLGGDSNNLQLSKELKKFLMFPQTNIVHLDLSNCGFEQAEAVNIKEGLSFNHTIYGFHFSGNTGLVDAQGYLNLNSNMNSFRNIHLNHRIDGVSSQSYLTNNERALVSVDNCWICEGWEEQEFRIDAQSFPSINNQSLVYVHIDFLQFNGVKTEYDESSKSFNTKIMCPPNQTIKFFFSCPIQSIQIASQFHVTSQIQQLNLNLPEKIYLQEGAELSIKKDLTIINILKTKVGQVIDESTFHSLVTCIPRPIIIDQQKIKKKSWKLETSIWRWQAQINHEQTIKDSFEMDFNSSKISKLIKDETELQNCKSILSENYEKIMDLFKGLSFISAIGNNFFITINQFNKFIVESEFIDNIHVKVSDLDLKFISSCSSKPNNSIRIGSVSDRGLARFQFLEVIVRLIQKKYVNSSFRFNIIEALEEFFSSEPIKKILNESHSANLWRVDELWNEQCYLVIKQYMFFIQAIFSYYSSSNKNNTIKIKYMLLQEFKQFCKDANCQKFNDSEENTSYGYSIIYQVDELYSERYIQMHFLEFVEGIARLSQKADFLPKDYQIPKVHEDIQLSTQKIHLSHKLQGFFEYLYLSLPIEDIINKVTNSSIKYNFDRIFEKKGISRFNDNQQLPNSALKLFKISSFQFNNHPKLSSHSRSVSQIYNQNKLNLKEQKDFKKQSHSNQRILYDENNQRKQEPQLTQQKSFSLHRASRRLSIYKQIEQNNPSKKKEFSKVILSTLKQNNQIISSIQNIKKENQSTYNNNNDNN